MDFKLKDVLVTSSADEINQLDASKCGGETNPTLQSSDTFIMINTIFTIHSMLYGVFFY